MQIYNTALSLLKSKGLSEESLLSLLNLGVSDVIYLSGSVVEGLGDGESDIDIFVLTSTNNIESRKNEFSTERLVQQHYYNFGIKYININGIELDVEFHPIEKFERLFSSLNALAPITRKSMWECFRFLGEYQRDQALELLHRFHIGIPIGDLSNFSSLKGRFDENLFFQWNVSYCVMECEDYTKGIKRSVRENDLQSALLKLRYFYDSLVDATLFDNGISLDRWKWRLPKLRKIDDEELLNDYLSVQFLKTDDISNLGNFVLEKHLKGLHRYEILKNKYDL